MCEGGNMCLSIEPTSLYSQQVNTLTICCAHHRGVPQGTYFFLNRNGEVIGDVGQLPGYKVQVDDGSTQVHFDPCIVLRVIPPSLAVEFTLYGGCDDRVTGERLCTGTHVLPVYNGFSADGILPIPANAPIPEPFRRDDATPEVANDPEAWSNY